VQKRSILWPSLCLVESLFTIHNSFEMFPLYDTVKSKVLSLLRLLPCVISQWYMKQFLCILMELNIYLFTYLSTYITIYHRAPKLDHKVLEREAKNYIHVIYSPRPKGFVLWLYPYEWSQAMPTEISTWIASHTIKKNNKHLF
jgi:hypothetical protein